MCSLPFRFFNQKKNLKDENGLEKETLDELKTMGSINSAPNA
jgi:hypothetical protein